MATSVPLGMRYKVKRDFPACLLRGFLHRAIFFSIRFSRRYPWKGLYSPILTVSYFEGFAIKWYITEVKETEVVSEPAPILVIQVVKISALVNLEGLSECILSSLVRNDPPWPTLILTSFSWPRLFEAVEICCSAKAWRWEIPDIGSSVTNFDNNGCHSE